MRQKRRRHRGRQAREPYLLRFGAPTWTGLPPLVGERPGVADWPLPTATRLRGLLLSVLLTVTMLILEALRRDGRQGAREPLGLPGGAQSLRRARKRDIQPHRTTGISAPLTVVSLAACIFIYSVRSERYGGLPGWSRAEWMSVSNNPGVRHPVEANPEAPGHAA